MVDDQCPPPPEWANDLSARLADNLGPDFYVSPCPLSDGGGFEVVLHPSKYREPHGRVLIVEDDDPERTRCVDLLLGIQGDPGALPFISYMATPEGIDRLCGDVRGFYRMVDQIASGAAGPKAAAGDAP